MKDENIQPSAFILPALILPKLAYKPHSVGSWMPNCPAIIYLGALLLTPSCSLPGCQMGRAAPSSCLALLLAGFACPATLLPLPVVSYTAVSPSLSDCVAAASTMPLCCTFRRVAPPGC